MWDVTVVCTTADSYIDLAVQGPGCVAEIAASRKEAKYATLRTHIMIFSRSRSRRWVLSMSWPLVFCVIWVGVFRS